MKIGIIGIRGIPNQYGGFEQFVEFVGPALAGRGHEVFVYNSSLHPYMEPTWKGVQLIRKLDPENRIGTFGQFIYDLNCIRDSRKRDFDIILQLGYTSSSVWSFLFPKRSVVVTNMDGLEWKRSKYSKPTQQFLKMAERWAATYSDKLIADSTGIQDYLLAKYRKSAAFIAYGATPFTQPDRSVLENYDLQPYQYNLLIARMEPENNIETVLQGYRQSNTTEKLILIGSYTNSFGSYLREKYGSANIVFWGAIYDFQLLNNLRHFSHLYFHGHSVGGTNPSLLEAMASQALIVSHDNIFNRSVLKENAFYFSNPAEIADIINRNIRKTDFATFIDNNNQKIEQYYSWDYITNLLEEYLSAALYERTKK